MAKRTATPFEFMLSAAAGAGLFVALLGPMERYARGQEPEEPALLEETADEATTDVDDASDESESEESTAPPLAPPELPEELAAEETAVGEFADPLPEASPPEQPSDPFFDDQIEQPAEVAANLSAPHAPTVEAVAQSEATYLRSVRGGAESPAAADSPLEQPAPPAEIDSPPARFAEIEFPGSAVDSPQDESEADVAAAAPPELSAPRNPGQQGAWPSIVGVRASAFRGIRPGESTMEDLQYAWGEPNVLAGDDLTGIASYDIAPFSKIEVELEQGLVRSIVIHFVDPLEVAAVEEQLALSEFAPAVILGGGGEALGQVYPERGVLVSFDPKSEAASVSHVVLDPLDAQAFVLRAEQRTDRTYAERLADVETSQRLDPGFARAPWLRAKLLNEMGRVNQALAAIEEAVDALPQQPEVLLTYAEILLDAGRPEDAAVPLKAIAAADDTPLLAGARANVLRARVYMQRTDVDYEAAFEELRKAIRIADGQGASPDPEQRRIAKRVLFDAHLAAAENVAWGGWRNKEEAVAKWLARARTFALDLVENEGDSPTLTLQAATSAVSAAAGMQGAFDPSLWVRTAETEAERLLETSQDPDERQAISRRLALMHIDAAAIAYARKDAQAAIAHGTAAEELLTQLDEAARPPEYDYLLGSLLFRIGATHAVCRQDHAAAVTWYDDAAPRLATASPQRVGRDRAGHAETWVSMAVSYWRTDQKAKALELTERGVALLEEAVADGAAPRASLAVPYQNLAAMHNALGRDRDSDRFQRLARAVENSNTTR